MGRVDQSETALGAEMRRGAETKPKATDKDKIVGRELKSVLTGATLVDGIVEDMSKHCVSIKVRQSFKRFPDFHPLMSRLLYRSLLLTTALRLCLACVRLMPRLPNSTCQ